MQPEVNTVSQSPLSSTLGEASGAALRTLDSVAWTQQGSSQPTDTDSEDATWISAGSCFWHWLET